MRSHLKIILQKVFFVRKSEKIKDAILRHKYNFLKKLPHKSYSKSDLKRMLKSIGIEKGDCIMVHASWRPFLGFDGSPKDVVRILQDLVGNDGTVLMPANNKPKSLHFDVINTPNYSGVLSNVFCQEGAKRSLGGHFSVASKGYLTEEIIKEHPKSEYGFDSFSPYGKFSCLDNGKLIFLGLGRIPLKISLFHVVAYKMKNANMFGGMFPMRKECTLVDENGVAKKVNILQRCGLQNSDRNIKKLYCKVPSEHKKHLRIGYLDIVRMDAKPSLDAAIAAAKNGLTMYKASF